jgi:oxygen-independent coproporphyrinogen-3 oxidase
VTLVQLGIPQSLDLRDLRRAEIPGLYVHIPFCFHKCHYCDFYSITRQTPERMNNFVDLMLREAGLWRDLPVKPKTIFFGGGTPSLLPLDPMRRLINGLRDRFDFSQLNEFTVECNPATVSLEYSQMLREAGVDRLSFGAQSFDRTELAQLERHHDPDDVPRSIEIARQAGFTRLNVDLIYAIPGQSLESWSRSLEAAIALNTPHISCYGLTYEPNTPIAVKKRLGQLIPAEDSLELEMLHHTRARLAQVDKPAYEISNYAIAGEECRHNLLYWNGGSYAALGPSASSHVHGTRWKNRPHLGEWETSVAKDELPATDVEILTPAQRAGELAMLQLRLSAGLNYDAFAAHTGCDARALFADQLERLSKLQMIELDDRGFRLSNKGLNVADAVASEFLVVPE